MALGKRVKQRMDELHLTQEYVANYVGVKQPSIHALIQRDSRSSRHLTKLAEVLQTSPTWLETGVYDENRASIENLSPLAFEIDALVKQEALSESDQVMIQSLVAHLAAKNLAK